jgi:hypothetical protein
MIGEVINCMAMTRDARCARCVTCRIVRALENGLLELQNMTDIARHVDRIGDELGVISERVEEM